MSKRVDELLNLAEDVLGRVTRAGASEAKVVASAGRDLSVRVRLDEVERVEESTSRSLSVRASKGRRTGVADTSDLSVAGIERVVTDALELSDLAEEDPFAGLPDRAELAGEMADLGLFDPGCESLQSDGAFERSRRCERAARDFDSRITNSEGASFSRTAGAFALATSGGFRAGYDETYAVLRVRPVAADEGGKNRIASYWSGSRFLHKLEGEREVGAEAARRAIGKIGARKVPTANVPVVFDAEPAGTLIGLFSDCILGDAIFKRSSYLVDRIGTKVASPLVTMVDDPLLGGAPGSRPFDGDGLVSRRNVVVDRGELRTFLLDVYGARKLGSKSTGSAVSLTSTGAGPSNYFLRPGALTPEEIVESTGRGLFVTNLMGFGFNPVTGDFSRGASGFWIEGGALAFPVSEVTISLNVDELFKRVDAVGNDLKLKGCTSSPTFRVSEMTLAGT